VPRCMWWSYVVNFIIALVTCVTMLFCFGPLDDAINADVPYLQLFLNMNNAGVAIFLLVILLILIYIGNITLLATVSRETWAFARDKGFPFSNWISKMDRKHSIPFNSVYLTSALSALLCLINLGSSLAFTIIVSLSLLALLSTYTISIGCILLKRIRGQPLPPARWSLGRWGLFVNAWSFVYCCWAMVWCAMPAGLPVTAADANWGPALWAGVCLLAAVIYIFHGRKHYTPPVIFVEGRRLDDTMVQSTAK
jgi:choline transport protein